MIQSVPAFDKLFFKVALVLFVVVSSCCVLFFFSISIGTGCRKGTGFLRFSPGGLKYIGKRVLVPCTFESSWSLGLRVPSL